MPGDDLRKRALRNTASGANPAFGEFQKEREERRRVQQELQAAEQSVENQDPLPAVQRAVVSAQQETNSTVAAYVNTAEVPELTGTGLDPQNLAYERMEEAGHVLKAWKQLEEHIVEGRKAGARLDTLTDVINASGGIDVYNEAVEGQKDYDRRFRPERLAGPRPVASGQHQSVAQAAQLSQHQAGAGQGPAGGPSSNASSASSASSAARPRPWGRNQGQGQGKSPGQGGRGVS